MLTRVAVPTEDWPPSTTLRVATYRNDGRAWAFDAVRDVLNPYDCVFAAGSKIPCAPDAAGAYQLTVILVPPPRRPA